MEQTQPAATKTTIAEYSQTEAALAALEKEYAGKRYNVTTTAGMTEAKEARARVKKYRVDLEKVREHLKADVLKRGREIDGQAKFITERLAAIEGPIDAQIKEEEYKKVLEKKREEEEREARKRDAQTTCRSLRDSVAAMIGRSSQDIAEQISLVKKTGIPDNEHGADVVQARDDVVAQLTKLFDQVSSAEIERARQAEEQKKIAAERAELERQRQTEEAQRARERAAAEAREKEAQTKREAEEAQTRARFAEEKRKADAEREEADRKAREAREAADREAAKQRLEQDRADKQRREAEEMRLRKEREELHAKAEKLRIEEEKRAAEVRAAREAAEEKRAAEARAVEAKEREATLRKEIRADAWTMLDTFEKRFGGEAEFLTVVTAVRELRQTQAIAAKLEAAQK